MSWFKNKIFLIAISLIVVFLAVTFFLFLSASKPGTLPETQPQAEKLTGYPDNLLEGKIIRINLEEPKSLVMEANISKIVPEAGKMEKEIKIVNDTELLLYNLTNEQESSLQFQDLKPEDNILVSTKESTYQEVESREVFTALKITKMIFAQ